MFRDSKPFPSPFTPWQITQSELRYRRLPSSIEAGVAATGFFNLATSEGTLNSGDDWVAQPSNAKVLSAKPNRARTMALLSGSGFCNQLTFTRTSYFIL
jgi:hypothetical protein